MNFDALVVKESPGLCRCCLSEGCYKDLGTEYSWMNETEVYADMLLECFDISISQNTDGPNGCSRLICEVCITRLRDACNFKKQVLDSEKRFIDMVAKGEFNAKMIMYQAPMKCEEVTTEDSAEVEYLEEIDYEDDLPLKQVLESAEVTMAEDAIINEPVKVKGKRGRPRKVTAVVEKKAKLTQEKPRTSKSESKGTKPPDMTATKRNRLVKRNAIIIVEHTSVVPFKWHRQNYLCFYCHRSFKDFNSLKTHTKLDEASSSVKSAVSYLRRDEKVKIDICDASCNICKSKFESLDHIVQHLKGHKKIFSENCSYGVLPYRIKDTSYACALCDRQFQYFIKLNQHLNEHYGSYICENCGRSFLSQDRLRCHALSHGQKFQCTKCNESFDSLTERTHHEATVHNKSKVLKCFYCPETFNNYAQRKKHHKTSHDVEIPEYSCTYCNKTFQIMSKMQVHIKEVHLRERNFGCTMCDQKFFSKTHVQKHMVKHLGERIYQCEVCNKSYARKQTLRDHSRIHSSEKKFVCSICSQGFVQSNSLKLHLRVHHPESGGR